MKLIRLSDRVGRLGRTNAVEKKGLQLSSGAGDLLSGWNIRCHNSKGMHIRSKEDMAVISFEHLINLPVGTAIAKRALYDLIQYSKVPSSEYWMGEEFVINNTPQQGINWVGDLPSLNGVLVKVKPGTYNHDGWLDGEKILYRYSFKARKGVVSFKEKANLALLNQAEFGYPVLLYSEQKGNWIFEGDFGVVECAEEYVVLRRRADHKVQEKIGQGLMEGGKKYVRHLLSERNPYVIKILKSTGSYVCEICNEDFKARYGVEYIEAHHKIPLSSIAAKSVVTPDDLALLCSNCHSAVHVLMRAGMERYIDIKLLIAKRLGLDC